MKFRCLAMLAVLLMLPALAHGQTAIDCSLPAPTLPGVVRTGQAFNVGGCIPSTTTQTDPTTGTTETVPSRVDGITYQIDAQTPAEAGKPTLGAAVGGLQSWSFRTAAGVQKGNHTVIVTPWAYPLMADGVTPDTTKPKQNASPVSIPFVASDPIQTGAPPPIQKGRVIR